PRDAHLCRRDAVEHRREVVFVGLLARLRDRAVGVLLVLVQPRVDVALDRLRILDRRALDLPRLAAAVLFLLRAEVGVVRTLLRRRGLGRRELRGLVRTADLLFDHDAAGVRGRVRRRT